jgi:arylsulfatase A-like enzyme
MLPDRAAKLGLIALDRYWQSPRSTPMSRIGIFVLSLLLASSSVGLRAAETRPNVLFIFCDDQRADTIAATGNPVIQTPNLDRLAQSGLVFNRAYMQGGMHGATCVPSRAMLLSGMPLFRVDEKLRRDETWPSAFRRAGYTTFVSGKWHNGQPSLPASFEIARSMFLGGMTDPLVAPLQDLREGQMSKPRIASKHACAVFADEVIRFLSEHRGGPFFCYLPFDGPHDPHIVPDDFPIHYEVASIPTPANFLPQHPFDNGEMTVRDEQLLPWPRRADQVRTMIAEYYRYISYLDAQIGRVLRALDQSRFAANTIVVFAADSGVARGSHGLIGKQNLYEHSVRVPLVVRGPGIAAGQRTEAMCYLFDVLPTLGRVCGVANPKTSEGIDLSAVLRAPAKAGRGRLMFAYRDLQRAIRDDRWKLIRYPQVDRTQLFDLQADPHERANLAEQPEQSAKVAELTSLLEQEMKQFGDTALLKVAHPRPAAWKPPAPGQLKSPQKKGKQAAAGAPAVQPNILYVVADDLGWADVGYHGAKIRTPTIDRLAREGVELDQHYVQPVCTPTRTAIMSGRYPSRFGPHALVPSNLRALKPGTVTLASALKSVGYSTCLSGKWHLGSRPEWSPNQFGFDHSYGSLAGAADPWTHQYRPGPYAKTWHRDGRPLEEEGNATELVARQALQWIRQRRRPWFIYVPFQAVHIPVDAPEQYKQLYRNEKFYDDPVKNESYQRFAAYVSQMDGKIGEFIAALEETGQRDNTLVLFHSDNGGLPGGGNAYISKVPATPVLSSNLPLRGHKGQLYEGGIRVVALANWPGRLAAGKVTAPLHAMDWMPTLTRLAGYVPQEDLEWDGRDAWPLITGKVDRPQPRTIYIAYNRGSALRDGDWKLIAPKRGPCELFNLAEDPFEKADLASKEPERVARLQDLLQSIQKRDVTSLPEDLQGIKP